MESDYIEEQIDGITYVICIETGEVIEAKADFHVDDEKKAEWLLERLSEQDASMAALEAKKAALLANFSTMESRIKSKRDALLYKFQEELTTVARENLEKGKKSWVCPYGRVSFRTNPARVKVADPEKALAWAKEFDKDAIKVVEEFQISKMDAKLKDAMLAAPVGDLTERGFDRSPEMETVKIETGI